MMKGEMDTELDLLQLLRALLRRLPLLAALTVLGAALAFSVAYFLITPKYSATASLYVYNANQRSDAITSTDLVTSQKLVQTYIVVLTSNSVLDKVSAQIDYAYSPEEIRKMMKAEAINSTEAFRITIENASPAAAQRIANTIADVAPAELVRVVKAGSVEIIDYATLPERPSSPRVLRITAIGALLGLFLAGVIVVLELMFDTMIRTEEDLSKAFDIPVIGSIPSMTFSEPKEGDAYGKER